MATPTRWAGWIEPRAAMTGATVTISSTTVTPLAGATITVTPHSNVRVCVPYGADVECTALLTVSVLTVRCLLDGVAFSPMVNFKAPLLGMRTMLTGFAHFDLLANTAYTLTMAASCSGTGSTYSIFALHSGLGPVITETRLHPP